MRIFESYKLVKSGFYIKFVDGNDLYEGKDQKLRIPEDNLHFS